MYIDVYIYILIQSYTAYTCGHVLRLETPPPVDTVGIGSFCMFNRAFPTPEFI